jgi:hypothetical protein
MEPAWRERRRPGLAGQGPELKLGAYTDGAYTDGAYTDGAYTVGADTVGASMRNSTRARPK